MTQHRRFSGLKAGVLAVPTVAILALTGCAGSASSATGAGGAKEFSLSFATSNTIESPFQTLGEKYMEANPDVKITFNPQPNDSYDQTLRTQLQAGNASDIVVTSPGSGQGRSILPLAEAGFLEPLDDSAKDLLPEGSASTHSARMARFTARRRPSPFLPWSATRRRLRRPVSSPQTSRLLSSSASPSNRPGNPSSPLPAQRLPTRA